MENANVDWTDLQDTVNTEELTRSKNTTIESLLFGLRISRTVILLIEKISMHLVNALKFPKKQSFNTLMQHFSLNTDPFYKAKRLMNA